MKDKIIHLMKSEGLTTTRFAEILGIQPSAVSHLVSGRNNPRYDLLQKILRRFPRINPDWLLLDAEEPYRQDLDSEEDMSPSLNTPTLDDVPFGVAGSVVNESEESMSDDDSQSMFNLLKPQSKSCKSPIFVVLFYDDGSCERFSMR